MFGATHNIHHCIDDIERHRSSGLTLILQPSKIIPNTLQVRNFHETSLAQWRLLLMVECDKMPKLNLIDVFFSSICLIARKENCGCQIAGWLTRFSVCILFRKVNDTSGHCFYTAPPVPPFPSLFQLLLPSIYSSTTVVHLMKSHVDDDSAHCQSLVKDYYRISL